MSECQKQAKLSLLKIMGEMEKFGGKILWKMGHACVVLRATIWLEWLVLLLSKHKESIKFFCLFEFHALKMSQKVTLELLTWK